MSTRRRQVAQRRHAQSCRLQRDVDLPIFHQLDAFAERQVLDLGEILVRHASRGEDRPRVELSARFRRADRDALALQIGERLDARVGTRDDLDVVRVDRSDAAQFFERRLESGVLVAFPRVRQRVAERERNLAAAGLQQIEILHRSLGRLDRGLDLRHRLADRVGQSDAQRVVDAARSAGQHVDELVGGNHRTGDQRQCEGATDEELAHESSGIE